MVPDRLGAACREVRAEGSTLPATLHKVRPTTFSPPRITSRCFPHPLVLPGKTRVMGEFSPNLSET